MIQPPWSEIGQLQQEISHIKNQLNNKPDNHEIYQIDSRLDSLERTCREISSEINGVLSRLQEMEENIRLMS